jgi:hypothetical protein
VLPAYGNTLNKSQHNKHKQTSMSRGLIYCSLTKLF